MIAIRPDLSVLNCGAGDITFSFDPKDPQECARAERVVIDMLRRGYLLFAQVRGKLVRVLEFDAKRHEYVIAAGPGPEDEDAAAPSDDRNSPQLKSSGRKATRVSAHKTPVTGIALALEALRKVDRYGVTTSGEQYTGFAALPPPAAEHSDRDLARRFIESIVGRVEWREPYQTAAIRLAEKKTHPDVGGNAADFKRVQAARELLLGEAR